jgi:glutamate dehydrogenase
MTTEINPFAMAQKQFDHVADQLTLAHEVRAMLRWPMRDAAFLC